MKKTVSSAAALSTAIAIALGGVALSGQAAIAAPAPLGHETASPSTDAVDPAAGGTPGADAATGDTATGDAAADDASVTDEVPVAETAPSAEPDAGTADDTGDATDAVGAAGVGEEVPMPEAAVPATPGPTTEPAPVAALAATPAAPVITSPADGQSLEVTAADGATEGDVPVALAGTGQPGAEVALSFVRDDAAADVSTEADVSTVVGSDGTWTVTVGFEGGRWAATATQRSLDADGLADSDPSAESSVTRFEAIAQVLPQWAVVDQAGDEVYVADAEVDGEQRATVFTTGTTGTLYRAELTLVSEDGTRVLAPVVADEFRDGGFATELSVPVGVWRIAAKQVDLEAYPTHPGIKSASSAANLSPLITVLPSEAGVVDAPVVTSPGAGATITGRPDPRPGAEGYLEFDITGTGTPGASIALYGFFDDGTSGIERYAAALRGEIPVTEVERPSAGLDPVVVGSDGRWSTTASLRPGTWSFAAFQLDDRLGVELISDASVPVTFTLAAPVMPAVSTTVRGTSPTSLAYTGSSDSAPLAGLAGMLLVGLGAAAVVVSRRRASRG
ncbi:hypothetical protein ABID81_000651 [Frigoribacterium sp. PvP054]|uniref:hypothetical protein n=1 Tax=Frigoribacterium sp. PvP054 TaxID=3156438 RepID=UPI0033943114